jgi:hypothetical protein
MTRIQRAVALTLVAGLGLTACGEDGPDSADEPSASESTSTPAEEPSETPTEEASEEPKGPACADVWVAGETLPTSYAGCQDADSDRWVEAMVFRCSSGQRLVTYRRTFYAAKGEVVNESETPLARDPQFQKVLASCGA